MPKKEIEEPTKTRKILFGLSAVILIAGIIFSIICALYQWRYYSQPIKCDLSHNIILSDGDIKSYIDSIDDTKTLGDYINIKGWAFREGVDLKYFKTEIVLYQKDLSNALVFKTAMQTRTDVTQKYDDGFDYDSSGFITNIKSSLLEPGEYNIALLYNDTKTEDGTELILTQKSVVVNGEDE